MFKKRLPLLIIAVLVACVIFIPTVRAAAESALSIFRVADTKTIRITVSDLQNMMAAAEKGNVPEDKTDARTQDSPLYQLLEKAESGIKPLSDTEEFTAFPVKLPAALKDETPELYVAESLSQTVTLDTAKINDALSGLGTATLVDDGYNGKIITVTTPPAIMAEYRNVTLIETQNVYIDAAEDVINSLRDSFLSVPAISEDLRAQLKDIDPRTRDIYLPVIEGLGREINLGNATGYAYTSGDLAQVLGMLPGFAGNGMLEELQDENASVLVWTKDGVLYCLAGSMSDSELAQIARSAG